MAFLQRTHTCGALREEHVGQTVVLNGWVNTARAYNDQVFVDLRDRYGITQVVFEAEGDRALFDAAHEIRSEWVLAVKGKVRPRLPGKANPKLATGAVEVEALELQVLNRCPTPPFEVMSIPRRRCWAAARRRERATISSPVASSRVSGTPCRNRRSCTSNY